MTQSNKTPLDILCSYVTKYSPFYNLGYTERSYIAEKYLTADELLGNKLLIKSEAFYNSFVIPHRFLSIIYHLSYQKSWSNNNKRPSMTSSVNFGASHVFFKLLKYKEPIKDMWLLFLPTKAVELFVNLYTNFIDSQLSMFREKCLHNPAFFNQCRNRCRIKSITLDEYIARIHEITSPRIKELNNILAISKKKEKVITEEYISTYNRNARYYDINISKWGKDHVKKQLKKHSISGAKIHV